MKFFLKISMYAAVLIGGAYLAVSHIPSLKASIFEVVNPQVKEARLVQELSDNLDTLSTQISDSPATAAVVAQKKKLVADSQVLVAQIQDITTSHPGVVQQAVTQVASQVTTAIFGSPAASSTPVPTSSQSTSTSASADVAVTHPSASTVPCVAQ